ncbi:MAG: DUF418 domain-containing protein [candidate division Zixibacteria bacterium]|nr:DUF418 domain-containing protein [candidate division Zixibacteria bacterium]
MSENNSNELSAVRLFGPVEATERFVAVDILRGFALLGILVMNIIAFAYPGGIYFSPLEAGGFEGANKLAWWFSHLLFSQKFMTIFSMLFGAGLVLMSGRAKEKNIEFGKIYYRRVFWLFLIGMLHAYFIWGGDILVPYAVGGLLLYPLRKLSATILVSLGAGLVLFGILTQVGSGYMFSYVKSEAYKAYEDRQAGEVLSEYQLQFVEGWEGLLKSFNPTAEQVAEETAVFRDGYGRILKTRAGEVLQMHTWGMVMWIFWRVTGLMLIGMGLMKLGVFNALRSGRFYLILMIIGYAAGLPLAYYGGKIIIAHNFDLIDSFLSDRHWNYVGSVLVAMGHIGLVMLVCKSNLLEKLKRGLAAVGRMALTNYLFHSIVFTTVFYGYGLGLFNRIDRFYLLFLVFAMWLVQLYLSPVWLKYFRFGPVEWLWRTLTYWRRQPMRA